MNAIKGAPDRGPPVGTALFKRAPERGPLIGHTSGSYFVQTFQTRPRAGCPRCSLPHVTLRNMSCVSLYISHPRVLALPIKTILEEGK